MNKDQGKEVLEMLEEFAWPVLNGIELMFLRNMHNNDASGHVLNGGGGAGSKRVSLRLNGTREDFCKLSDISTAPLLCPDQRLMMPALPHSVAGQEKNRPCYPKVIVTSLGKLNFIAADLYWGKFAVVYMC